MKETRPNQHELSFTVEERSFLDKKLDSIDRKTRIEAMKKLLLSADSGDLSLKDQIQLEKLQILKQERPLRLRKLKAQTKILEGKQRFLNHFGAEISKEGSQVLQTQTEKKYGFGKTDMGNYNEAPKKNFFINKISQEYFGCCKVCGKFSTAACVSYQEAERDIEVHLEGVHQKELFQY